MKSETNTTVEVCSVVKFCAHEDCRREFAPLRTTQRFCSKACRSLQRYMPKKRATQERRNGLFKIRTRDFALGFDGRHGGNVNVSYTTPILQ